MDVAKIPRNLCEKSWMSEKLPRKFQDFDCILEDFPRKSYVFKDFGGMFFWMLPKFLGIFCVKVMDV